MVDEYLQMRSGEMRPIFGQATAQSGTLTIQAGAKITLYDATDQIVTGFNDIPATGYDAAALASPRVWYSLDISAAGPGGLLAPGIYVAVFKFTALGSDTLTRRYEPAIMVEILPTS